MQTLLLLHGAIGASVQLQPLAEQLKANYDVRVLNFTGHGGRAGTDDGFSMQLFAGNVLAYMAKEGLDTVSIFGYSMGGYVGMYLAKHHPEKIEKIITLATKYNWDETIAAKEVQMLNPDKIEQKLPAFANTLKTMHAPNDWKQLLNKTADMLTALGQDNTLKPADHPAITIPALLLLGDRDKMVSLEETIAVYKALPNAKMGMLPGTPHPIEQVNERMLAYFISDFLGTVIPASSA